MKLPEGEKGYKCNRCTSAFSQTGHLKAHLMMHSGETPYKCNQCDYASSYASNLRMHLITHSKQKSF